MVSGEAPAQQQCSTSGCAIAAAVPQYISGRTSYLRVRLAFHPYPQLIRAFCNRHRCGPPRPVRDASAWPWVAHTVSGQSPATLALFRLAFTPAPAGSALTTPPRITRRIILQKARGHRLPGSHGVEAHDFRVSFTPLTGVLFTVPSRYCALSVTACSLPWTVVCPASARVLRARTYSGTTPHAEAHAYATLTLSGAGFHTASAQRGRVRPIEQDGRGSSSNPVRATAAPLARARFRLHPVRSPLLRVSFTLPPATEMFQLAGFPLREYGALPDGSGLPHSETSGSQPARGSPEHIGAVPRPSSARSAMASIVCSSCLPSVTANGPNGAWCTGGQRAPGMVMIQFFA